MAWRSVRSTGPFLTKTPHVSEYRSRGRGTKCLGVTLQGPKRGAGKPPSVPFSRGRGRRAAPSPQLIVSTHSAPPSSSSAEWLSPPVCRLARGAAASQSRAAGRHPRWCGNERGLGRGEGGQVGQRAIFPPAASPFGCARGPGHRPRVDHRSFVAPRSHPSSWPQDRWGSCGVPPTIRVWSTASRAAAAVGSREGRGGEGADGVK